MSLAGVAAALSKRKPGRLGWLTVAIAGLAAVYFYQTARMGPDPSDAGLLLLFVEDMARGARPHVDFVDAYGPLNWLGPVAFYEIFGGKVWGVRIWIVLVKTIVVVLTFRFVALVAHGGPSERGGGALLYASLGALGVTVLLGAPWQFLQSPYAYLTALPLVLGVWSLIIEPAAEPCQLRLWGAAVATATALLIKLNTGVFLLCGGTLALLLGSSQAVHWSVRVVVPGACLAVIMGITRRHMSWMFALYLLCPLFLSMYSLVWHQYSTTPTSSTNAPIRRALQFLVGSVFIAASLLFTCFGKDSWSYVAEQYALLSSLEYTSPFPALGRPGHYARLNDLYWLQLPWLASGLFLSWMALGARGERAHGGQWTQQRSRVAATYLFMTMYAFELYARPDETHLHRVAVLAVPVVVILISHIEQLLFSGTDHLRAGFRVVVALSGALYASTLAIRPALARAYLGSTPWAHPKLEHLYHQPRSNPYLHFTEGGGRMNELDAHLDSAAACLRSVASPGEEVLLLTHDQLVLFLSDTQSVGGRYRFLFYLANAQLIDRPVFDKLTGGGVERVLRDPPRLIVGPARPTAIESTFPEWSTLRRRYRPAACNAVPLLVYERPLTEVP